MWGSSDSEENSESDSDTESPPDLTGLALAEYYFGPLLSPITATPAQWSAYTKHRRSANATFQNIFGRRGRSISNAVAAIEDELGLHDGTLQKCVSIMWRDVESDEDEPRNADILVRIYSPAAPKYIDVHIKYHYHSRMYETEWYYSLGYRIYDHISGFPTTYRDPTTNGPPSNWHTRGGWQPICWGCFDDPDGSYDRRRRRIEVGKMELHPVAILAIYASLFGPIEGPAGDDAYAVLEYRRKLIVTMRLLFAVVGISYKMACTDEESDESPDDFMLEGLSDNWVARGIRAACGFQLSDDAEAARRGQQERREQAEGEDEDGDDDEDGFADDGWY